MAQPQTAAASPRKGARIGPVSELSVFLKVKPGREQLIRDVFIQAGPWWKASAEGRGSEQKAPLTVLEQLEAVEGAEVKAAVKAVVDVGTVHNARYVLFDDGTRLLVSTTFDGDWDVYIDDFAASKVLDAWDHSSSIARGTRTRGRRRSLWTRSRSFSPRTRSQRPTSTSTTRGLRRRRSRRRCAFRRPSRRSLDNPGAGEALQHPALKPLREVAAD